MATTQTTSAKAAAHVGGLSIRGTRTRFMAKTAAAAGRTAEARAEKRRLFAGGADDKDGAVG